MPFPITKRVIYKTNPLEQVICQLRFPPILRIDAEIPAAFQDKVRGEFPNYSETSEFKFELPPGIKGSIPSEIVNQMLQSSGGKNYEFSSEDGLWKINLTRTFIALTSYEYERWEKFKDKLRLPLQALIEIYAPNYFSRIGLRYVDVIKRSVLGLQDTDWSELLQPYILGLLASQDVGSHVSAFESRHDINLADGESIVKIIMRYTEASDTGEVYFVIDSDFFTTNKTQIPDATEKLDFFSARGTRLFRWCITERLHDAMGPQAI